jgi:hypothetical protein
MRFYTSQETRLYLIAAFLEIATRWDKVFPEHSPQNCPAIYCIIEPAMPKISNSQHPIIFLP